MKILYDHQAFTYQSFGGVSKSFCELIYNLPSDVSFEISLKESNNIHLRDKLITENIDAISLDFNKFRHQHPRLGREKLYKFLSSIGVLATSEARNKKHSIQKIKDGRFDILHATFFDDYYLPYLGDKPLVITVHDMMPELFGWYKGLDQIKNKKKLCDRASAVIAVSENTKKDLCGIVGVSPEKVHVVYHGAPDIPKLDNFTKRLYDFPYFLYVGGRTGYKNFPQTLYDFAVFHRNYPEVKLVCTGGTLSDEEFQLAEKYAISEHIKTIFASDAQMQDLYSHAIAFIYPSLYEGFGMPILEAFSYGCLVLLNNTSCFPEVADEAAYFFESSPGNSNLPELLEMVYKQDISEKKSMIAKGYKRLESFSWQKSSRQLADIYKSII